MAATMNEIPLKRAELVRLYTQALIECRATELLVGIPQLFVPLRTQHELDALAVQEGQIRKSNSDGC